MKIFSILVGSVLALGSSLYAATEYNFTKVKLTKVQKADVAKRQAQVVRLLQGSLVLVGNYQLPADNDGIDIYVGAPADKKLDFRGVAIGSLNERLRNKPRAYEPGERVTITMVAFKPNMIEVHLGGGGGKSGKGIVKGGSRINVRYPQNFKDMEPIVLAPTTVLTALEPVLRTDSVRLMLAKESLPKELQKEIERGEIAAGMNYSQVLMALGQPEEKKATPKDNGDLAEIWLYMKADGQRIVVNFFNGNVEKVNVYGANSVVARGKEVIAPQASNTAKK